MNRKEFDRNERPRNKVQVRIVLPDVKTYQANAEIIKQLAEQTGGTLAVKMVCN